MLIIYLCPSGTISSLIAAYLHLGKLNLNSSIYDIIKLPYFNKHRIAKGKFFFIGKDEYGNKIYTLGTGKEAKLIIKSAKDLLNIFGKRDNLLFVDVTKFTPNRVIGMSRITAAYSLKRSLPFISKEVNNVKKHLKQEL